jgi:hypothetical protein
MADKGNPKAKRRDWFKLDNAAVLFPTVASGNISTLFRLSATLKAPVNYARLRDALSGIYRRFPYFNVELHAGFFWYYFELLPSPPAVMPDSKFPCMNISIMTRGRHLFRVRAYDRRIAVEFSHIITDGTGAAAFLKSLLAEYLRPSDAESFATEGIPAPDERVDPEEFEDAFRRYGDLSLPGPYHERKAFHVPCEFLPAGEYRITAGTIPLEAVTRKAKAEGVSLTEFLCAVYIAGLQEIYEGLDELERIKFRRFIKLMVPVNLRRHFPSKTMRNFSLYVLPGIDCRLGHYEFGEIVAAVHHGMRLQNTAKRMSQQIARNARGAVAPAIRIMPLFLKKFGGRMLYRHFGEDLYSGCLTNLGPVNLPPAMSALIEHFDLVPAPAPITRTNCAVISYGNELRICFGSLVKEREIERLFFTRLIKMGIPVRIETNV